MCPPWPASAIVRQCILRIAYEALALVTDDDKKTPLTIFKYQDIICWGSNTSVFQFKVG